MAEPKDPRLGRRSFVGIAAAGVAGAGLMNTPAARATTTPRWRPDGANLPRLGLLIADVDFNPEPEVAAMNRGAVSVFASRMPIRFTPEILTDFTHANSAIDLLRELRPRAVLYASTSTSYYLGPEGETQFADQLAARLSPYAPIILPARALAEAARAMGVRRIALVHPPWFSDAPHEAGGRYFAAQGFDVVSSLRMTPRRDFVDVAASEVHDWIVANTPREAQAVVQGGNGLRAVGAIDAIERSLGKPVFTANQAMFWAGLNAAKAEAPIEGYGRLLRERERAVPAK